MQKADTPTTTLSELEQRVGSLSAPSKMPGYAWGISAQRCITGSKLHLQEGASCSKCYALKGRYCGTNVVIAQERRYNAWRMNPIAWAEDMAELIERRSKNIPFFRWFDSGDLQSVGMLWDIYHIANATPHIQHWLPTQERSIVAEAGSIPSNVTVRISAPMINGGVPVNNQLNSVVVSKVYKRTWEQRVDRSTKTRFYCLAPLQDNQCGTCRACWDKSITTVAYLEH